MLKRLKKSAYGKKRLLSSDETVERQKGRLEKRQVSVFTILPAHKELWQDIKTSIKVVRSGSRKEKGKTIHYRNVSYYMSDIILNASSFAKAIRQHWSIENKLHWVKDAIFKEDKSRIKTGKAPEAFSILRAFAIRMHSKPDRSVTESIRLVYNKIPQIVELII